ncbi:MAG: adhesion lipoprotein [Phycisphaeraceae bacterium]|nr:adhesion lipoprotein [Phycisphaeraceae bacterium]
MKVISALIVLGCFLGGCGEQAAPPTVLETTGKPVIYTTFYPTSYFAQRIGGEAVEVVCPVPEDEDAIFWMPDDATIAAYQKADLIVVNGAGFEKWVKRVSLPDARVIDTARPFRDRFLRYEGTTTHSHGPAGEHAHEGVDGHTWVDPVNARIQADEIRKALARFRPEQAATFGAGFEKLAADLDALDKTLRALSGEDGGPPLLASHPAYNYVADRYGWHLVNLDLDPETMPDDATFAAIRKILDEHPANFILWEGEPTAEIAERFSGELGLTSVLFSPCELLSGDEIGAGLDYLKVMRQNLKQIEPVFMTK